MHNLIYTLGIILIPIAVLSFVIYCIVKRKPLYYVIIAMVLLQIVKILDNIFADHETILQAVLHPFDMFMWVIIIAYVIYHYKNKT